ncbi:MAG: hypothetical protein PHV34_21895 [Verrucomicrobiae bacterium]|nr:hypothetical protein [Verrucomicrobiae bacterium]
MKMATKSMANATTAFPILSKPHATILNPMTINIPMKPEHERRGLQGNGVEWAAVRFGDFKLMDYVVFQIQPGFLRKLAGERERAGMIWPVRV